VKIGSYIRHFLYKNRGERIYRYGIVIEVIRHPPPKNAKIFWHPTIHYPFYKKSYLELIKIKYLEMVSEP